MEGVIGVMRLVIFRADAKERRQLYHRGIEEEEKI